MGRPSSSLISVIVALSVSLTSSLFFLRLQKRSIKPDYLRRKISSPRDTLLPQLSADEVAALPYPPHILPGGRDVETLYGTMRVYEWGPEDGRKVLLIHGDTTPAPMFGPIASKLVQRGCRVMIFGRLVLILRLAGVLRIIALSNIRILRGLRAAHTLPSVLLGQ